MSDVISFRLNRENPREAQALEILDAWGSRGYSVRYVITEALLKLHGPGPESIVDKQIPELSAVLNQVNKLLEQFGNRGYSPYLDLNENHEQSRLAANFVASIKKGVKPGLNLIICGTRHLWCARGYSANAFKAACPGSL